MDRTLEELNRRLDSPPGAFTRQAGLDEFAGVLRPGNLSGALVHLWEHLHPVNVRFVVVQGELDVVPEVQGAPSTRNASGFDGPAFHAAAELLEELRGSRESRSVFIRLGGRERDDVLLSDLGDLLYAKVLDWTDRQMEVHRVYRTTGSQEATAEELRVSQSTVSRVLAAADHRRVVGAISRFSRCLDEASKEAV